MGWILAVGITLVTVPIVGFIACGCFMLWAALKDDNDGDKVIMGMLASVLIGGAFLVAYAGVGVFVN